MTKNVFSEFEIKESGMRFNDAETSEIAKRIGCVGSAEESFNIKEITKKCEGVIRKTVVKPDGGELKVSLHMDYDLFNEAYGMNFDDLKEGVHAYGTNSVHKEFTYTCKIIDEDGEVKLKAYPKCVISSGIARKVENGSTEVAEIEMTIKIMPDENDQLFYERLASKLTEELQNEWLTKFSRSIVEVSEA